MRWCSHAGSSLHQRLDQKKATRARSRLHRRPGGREAALGSQPVRGIRRSEKQQMQCVLQQSRQQTWHPSGRHMQGIDRLGATFAACSAAGRTAFVAFLTCGYPAPAATPALLRALQDGGADAIELGLPFSDPVADGATIQHANTTALEAGTTIKGCIEAVRVARSEAGVTAPIILMGYYNPLLAYGLEAVVRDAAAAGADGFIVVDLPIDEAGPFMQCCEASRLSLVPLVTPATPESRLAMLASPRPTSSFLYCVSVTGVTGARTSLPEQLPAFLERVRKYTTLPLCVGFGISKREHVVELGTHAEGVVVGTAIVNAVGLAGETLALEERVRRVRALVHELSGGPLSASGSAEPASKRRRVEPAAAAAAGTGTLQTPARFHFGDFGGRYIPETLVAAHDELEAAFDAALADPQFLAEVARLRREFIGGPTPLYHAQRLSALCGGAQIWLKREDMAHTGAHKINNAMGQALLAKRLGKSRIIAETGAGQHGVATATACAYFGLDCTVYMGAEDVMRQSLNVFRMKILGAKVVAVHSGTRTLKDAINEAMRDWVTNVATTHYIIGSAVGAHPFPKIVRFFQSVVGSEAREQILAQAGRLPDYVMACVGGGSNAIGMFHPFVGDASVKLVGVEAGGEGGVSGGKHSATLTAGVPGVLHGAMSYVLQTADGQISETHSISAGLDYPGVGPEHAFLKASGRATYTCATDSEALEALQTLSKTEGVIPALEPSHSLHEAMRLAKQLPSTAIVLMLLSGRGDKDMITVAKAMGVTLEGL
eukprot:TRINITY_DN5592_c0_g1_i1.p2 TRINITY_DN5592_c0_g1~~TRINITY_DN5592_c0_g1_i1.p2  ORF type:complete len:773 (-),score=152.50 TRINITY_DN5592_c0_g1_i1:173-2491(-)